MLQQQYRQNSATSAASKRQVQEPKPQNTEEENQDALLNVVPALQWGRKTESEPPPQDPRQQIMEALFASALAKPPNEEAIGANLRGLTDAIFAGAYPASPPSAAEQRLATPAAWLSSEAASRAMFFQTAIECKAIAAAVVNAKVAPNSEGRDDGDPAKRRLLAAMIAAASPELQHIFREAYWRVGLAPWQFKHLCDYLFTLVSAEEAAVKIRLAPIANESARQRFKRAHGPKHDNTLPEVKRWGRKWKVPLVYLPLSEVEHTRLNEEWARMHLRRPIYKPDDERWNALWERIFERRR